MKGVRSERKGPAARALAVVSPVNVREVELTCGVAGHYSLPLAALGAGTALDVPGAPGRASWSAST